VDNGPRSAPRVSIIVDGSNFGNSNKVVDSGEVGGGDVDAGSSGGGEIVQRSAGVTAGAVGRSLSGGESPLFSRNGVRDGALIQSQSPSQALSPPTYVKRSGLPKVRSSGWRIAQQHHHAQGVPWGLPQEYLPAMQPGHGHLAGIPSQSAPARPGAPIPCFQEEGVARGTAEMHSGATTGGGDEPGGRADQTRGSPAASAGRRSSSQQPAKKAKRVQGSTVAHTIRAWTSMWRGSQAKIDQASEDESPDASNLANLAPNIHSFMSSTPQKWGRHLSSTIDGWSATLLPIAFFTYLAIEFSGHYPHIYDGQPRPDMFGKIAAGDPRLSKHGFINHTGITVYTTDQRNGAEATVCYLNLQYLSQYDYDRKWHTLKHRQRTVYDAAGKADPGSTVCGDDL